MLHFPSKKLLSHKQSLIIIKASVIPLKLSYAVKLVYIELIICKY